MGGLFVGKKEATVVWTREELKAIAEEYDFDIDLLNNDNNCQLLAIMLTKDLEDPYDKNSFTDKVEDILDEAFDQFEE